MQNPIKRIYVNNEGILCYELKVKMIITDIYKNGFVAKMEGYDDEDFLVSTPEVTKDGQPIFKVGDEVIITITK